MNPTFNAVVKFGKRLGLKVVVADTIPDSAAARNLDIHYEDFTIYVKQRTWSRQCDLIHEYGHFLASTPRNRAKVNYGLRMGVLRGASRRDQRREENACKYELALMKYLKFSDNSIVDRANHLNCFDYIRKYTQSYLRRIKKAI